MSTEAGRAAFKRAELHRGHWCAECVAEARAAVLRELREEVAGMEGQCHDGEGLGCDSFPCVVNVSRREVLAAIDRRLGDD